MAGIVHEAAPGTAALAAATCAQDNRGPATAWAPNAPRDPAVDTFADRAIRKTLRGTVILVMRSDTNSPQSSKRCPLCGIAMLGIRSNPESKLVDIFHCLRCETIIDSSGSGTSHPLKRDG